MFEKAARMKLRFDYRGPATVEDLWDLSVENLDGIYQKLRVQQKESSQESLLNPPPATKELDLKVDIVKHIVGVKLEERALQLDRAKRRERKQRIAQVLADKQDQALQNMSEAELAQMLADMNEE